MKTIKTVKLKRKFSEEFKKLRVQEYERGDYTAIQLGRMYQIGPASIYNWIYKYSNLNQKKVLVVESKNSSSEKLKDFEKRIEELERIVGQKQIKIEYLEKLIEIAGNDYQIDIKKNSDTPQSNGSVKTEKK